jgi:hypothetical protein
LPVIKSFRQARLALDIATDRYKYGVITNLDLLTSLTNFKDAQLSRLQFECNLLLSRMELCRLAGIRWWEDAASPVTRHASSVTRHPSPVTRHLSPVTRHPSPVTRHLSRVTRHPSPFYPR